MSFGMRQKEMANQEGEKNSAQIISLKKNNDEEICSCFNFSIQKGKKPKK